MNGQKIRIICNGKSLEDYYTLADYNIREGYVLHITLLLHS